jgi:hypothetical protein
MKVIDRIQTTHDLAVEALKAVLHQVSAIKLKNIDSDSAEPKSKADFVAHVDVYGHSHTLICMMMSGDEPQSDREALAEFCDHALQFCDNATPVVIAPRFSEDALALCRENKAGLLDLDGNARIDLGEVFIARQLLPQVTAHPPRVSAAHTVHRNLTQRLSRRRSEVLSPAHQGAVA